MGSLQERQARQGSERQSLICPLIIQFRIPGKPTFPHDPYNLLILHAFNLGVLCVLGAILFPAPKWVRAKNANLAKAQKSNH